MKVKTSKLIGAALDWAVAKCEGVVTIRNFPGLAYIPKGKRSYYKYTPSTNWKQGGPILERENISVQCFDRSFSPNRMWNAYMPGMMLYSSDEEITGPTPLIAAMRCYCCAKLGCEIEIPEELQPCQQPNP